MRCHQPVITTVTDFVLIDERKISGKGILKPPVDNKLNRMYVLYLDVVRPPKSPYRNYNYNPPRGRYASLVFLRNSYVIDEKAMEYERQSFDGVQDVAGQALIAIKCANRTALKNLAALSTALNVAPVYEGNIIKDYENLNLSWDEIRVVCYADTAVNIRLYSLNYASCEPESDDSKSPPPPPPPPNQVPPGTPINDLSPPYEGDEANPNTAPYPGDKSEDPEPPPPPEPVPCDKVKVTVLATYANGSTSTLMLTQYAPIVRAYVADNGTAVKVQGGAQVGTVGCDGRDDYGINYALNFNPGNPFVTAVIVSKEVVP